MHNGSPSDTTRHVKTADAMVVCEKNDGVKIQGNLLRLARHEVSFEIHGFSDVVRMSEVMTLSVLIEDRLIYTGRAVVSSLVNARTVLICQASLEDAWLEINLLSLARTPRNLQNAFGDLIRGWQKVYKVLPEYKLAIADIQSFLFELNQWVEEIEVGLPVLNGSDRTKIERAAIDDLLAPVSQCLNHLFEIFEMTSRNLDPQIQPAHGLYAKRQLHPLLMCSPFMHRIFRKPLGYAGDYEMVNMIIRDPHEGNSLFAKLLNAWFLSQPPAEAHRNRIKFLTQRLLEETLRVRRQKSLTRIFNLGCGPAGEIQEFLRQSHLSNHAEFSLLDFNDETIAFTKRTLEEIRHATGRNTKFKLIKKSVAQVLKSDPKMVRAEYDVVYCAGLFDYLNDRVCRQLLAIFYAMLLPGGLLIVTNVDDSNSIRNVMGYIFEWRLIERNSRSMLNLVPEEVREDHCTLAADSTGCNIFLEIRKPL